METTPLFDPRANNVAFLGRLDASGRPGLFGPARLTRPPMLMLQGRVPTVNTVDLPNNGADTRLVRRIMTDPAGTVTEDTTEISSATLINQELTRYTDFDDGDVYSDADALLSRRRKHMDDELEAILPQFEDWPSLLTDSYFHGASIYFATASPEAVAFPMLRSDRVVNVFTQSILLISQAYNIAIGPVHGRYSRAMTRIEYAVSNSNFSNDILLFPGAEPGAVVRATLHFDWCEIENRGEIVPSTPEAWAITPHLRIMNVSTYGWTGWGAPGEYTGDYIGSRQKELFLRNSWMPLLREGDEGYDPDYLRWRATDYSYDFEFVVPESRAVAFVLYTGRETNTEIFNYAKGHLWRAGILDFHPYNFFQFWISNATVQINSIGT